MKLEVGKKYKTRDGRVFTIFSIDDDPTLPVAAEETEDVEPYWYRIDGLLGREDYSYPDDCDLVSEAPTPTNPS